MTIEEVAVGLIVIYKPKFGPEEKGIIVGASDKYVFVRYGDRMTPQATRPEDLEVTYE